MELLECRLWRRRVSDFFSASANAPVGITTSLVGVSQWLFARPACSCREAGNNVYWCWLREVNLENISLPLPLFRSFAAELDPPPTPPPTLAPRHQTLSFHPLPVALSPLAV